MGRRASGPGTGGLLVAAFLAVMRFPAFGQDSPLPAESALSADPALARGWADRVRSGDRKVRSEAVAALVRGGAEALPLLRRFLDFRGKGLHGETFEIIRRIGPDAVPLLTGMLKRDPATVRLQAVGILIDLAPDSEAALPDLVEALKDREAGVARDAARALGALGAKAGPSVRPLVGALSHGDLHVRIYAAEALASIGPDAAAAIPDLARALREPAPGVRWAAAEALGAIGPPAAPAVPQLAGALKDEYLFVRICAAGALGSIGPGASGALESLKEAAADPALRSEAEWALERIAGAAPGGGEASAAPAAGMAAGASEEAPAGAGHPPSDWDLKTGRHILWSAALGNDTFGRPVVSGDSVYVGTDNGRPRNAAFRGDCGALMAFRAHDGAFLWQDLAPRVNRGLREFLLPSTTSAPYVEGDRLYYVTAECQLRCLDTRGFRDGENDGPFREEAFRDDASADIVWELDLCGRLGVFPHEASNSEVVSAGGLLLVCTSNGRNEGHTRVPSPRAPSLIAVDKGSGDVVWRAAGPGGNVLHGQWCSPVVASVNGRAEALFGGGDGWLRSYDAASGRELWRFDGNPGEAKWYPRPGVFSRSPIVASPLCRDGRVFVAMGQDPSHGNGPALLHAVSPNGQGDVTGSRCLWTCREVGRVVGTPVAGDGLLYVGDLGGTVHCLEAATGKGVWRHETHAAIWGCLQLARDRLYAGNVDGVMTVLRAGRRKEALAEIGMGAPLYARPALSGDSLYVAAGGRLYRIAAKP